MSPRMLSREELRECTDTFPSFIETTITRWGGEERGERREESGEFDRN